MYRMHHPARRESVSLPRFDTVHPCTRDGKPEPQTNGSARRDRGSLHRAGRGRFTEVSCFAALGRGIERAGQFRVRPGRRGSEFRYPAGRGACFRGNEIGDLGVQNSRAENQTAGPVPGIGVASRSLLERNRRSALDRGSPKPPLPARGRRHVDVGAAEYRRFVAAASKSGHGGSRAAGKSFHRGFPAGKRDSNPSNDVSGRKRPAPRTHGRNGSRVAVLRRRILLAEHDFRNCRVLGDKTGIGVHPEPENVLRRRNLRSLRRDRRRGFHPDL